MSNITVSLPDGSERFLVDEEYLLSTFETPTARGRWEKKSTQGNVEVGGTIYDQVLLWAK